METSKETVHIPDEIRTKLVNTVNENWDELIQAIMDLAQGIWMQEKVTDKNGVLIDVRVYQQKPDREVAKYLTDQVIGKPKESMNIEGRVALVMDE